MNKKGTLSQRGTPAIRIRKKCDFYTWRKSQFTIYVCCYNNHNKFSVLCAI